MEKKVTLISVDGTIGGAGILALSSHLKKYDYECQVIFLPTLNEEYPLDVLIQLEEICSGSALVGVTAMSYTINKAFQIATQLKKSCMPLIIGGIHATLNPEECLNYFDYVCVGEGEDALLDLVTCLSHDANKKLKPENIKNIWIKKKGKLIKNKLRPLIKNINTLPFPDYNFNGQLILIKNKIVHLKPEHFSHGEHNLSNLYLTGIRYFITMHTSRGCLYNCKYCCNYDLKILYKKCKAYVRNRDVNNVIYNLKNIKKEILPQIRFVWFTDDDFLARDLRYIKKFSKKYSEEIKLPFMCYVTPSSIDELKLKELIFAGLHRVQVGIQSGSEKTQINLYNRTIKNEQIIQSTRILNRFGKFKLIPPEYQIINTNPLETDDDLFETLKLLYALPRPYRLEVFNLVFFPGSRFAKEHGISKKNIYTLNYLDETAHFASKGSTLYNKLIGLLRGKWNKYRCGRLPSPFLRILLKNKERAYKFRFIISLLDKIPMGRRIFFALPPNYQKVYLSATRTLLRTYLMFMYPFIHRILIWYLKTDMHLHNLLYTLKKK